MVAVAVTRSLGQVLAQGLLKQATTKLTELRTLIDRIATTSERSKVPLLAVHAWHKKQDRLLALQEDIKTIKCTLNIMPGASNSQDMTRIRLYIEDISTTTSQFAQEQAGMKDGFIETLSRHQEGLKASVSHVASQVDKRIVRVEELLKVQSERLQDSQPTQLGPYYKAPPPYRGRRSTQYSNKGGGSPRTPRAESIGVRVMQQITTCTRGCSCACHKQRRFASPALLERIIGQIFVDCAGLPIFSQKCNVPNCTRGQSPHVRMEYWFPLGFVWSKIVHLQIAYLQNAGPQMQLNFLRRVPDSAPCIDFALYGNIDGLKDLFIRGLASPRDVSSTRGYSVLRWALYGKQWETCKFLVNAGADPDYRPISAHDNNPRNKAFDFILQGFLSKEEVETLGCLTAGSDWVEDQNYTLIHKIVTGLCFQSLEEAILLYPDDIDAIDGLGRTPLTWAAVRGDEKAVVTLLSYGADPNTLDIQWTGPVSYAAERGHVVCVRLLLEAGACPDPIIPGGLKIGSPLNCAARNSPDALVLKTLLDFGADVDASGVDGKTPLIHVSRTNNASFATLLLEYGANINAADITSHTPLTTAITYNSHNVLQLLLDRWSEYSSCPRLQGPHLLETAAVFADLETLKILVATDHFRLKYDKDYVFGVCAARVQDRYDVDEHIIAAFQDLISVISDIPEMAENGLSRLEAGLLLYKDSPLIKNGLSERWADNSSEASFEDAMESLII
ncbi:ankyrin repeat-containing protein [Halenospora varia]|nr:ankyrin repeat-containing protein [Halenospora varia]